MKRIGSIQGLKGIAAFVVFLSHVFMTYKSDLVTSLKYSPFHFFFDGECSVMIFFAISGFFYYNSKPSSISSYFSGVKKKIIKIYPPYIIIMMIGYFFCNLHLDYPSSLFTEWSNSFWTNDVSFIELFKQLSILYPHNSSLINPPVWYMNIEVKCFLIIPLIMIAFKSKFGGLWCLLPFWIIMPLGKLNYIGSYLIGSYCRYLLINKPSITNILNSLLLRVFLIVLGIIMLNIRNEILFLPEKTAFIIQSLGASIIVSIIYYMEVCHKPYSMFDNKVCRWMGNISYEFYLIHFIVLLCFKSFGMPFWAFFIITMSVSILLSLTINKLLASISEKLSCLKTVI